MITGAITPGYATLEFIAQQIDRFPHLTQPERAELFSAIDLAPASFPDPRAASTSQEQIDATYEAYFRSPAAAAWNRVKEFPMLPYDEERIHAMRPTLHQCAAYEEAPTRADIMKALDRAARMTKEAA